ncbi:MAG: 16S rRNA (adenine(1518)-N(6)/adenine(1519)-N(6))-dimethyltransferase RsmA [Desulfobacterota bacterium]|nr:16S rRNA (adenine(1518)-N(6)/adenine(1519)-N(6))-dimethyltransferase RsmA [Thermodesulfobacteriota bacterium]
MEVVTQKKLIRDFLVKPQKNLGQHFIIHEQLFDKIIENSNLASDDVVVEIGAGLGGLTTRLAKKVKVVFAIEKDGNLVNLLKSKIIKNENIKIIHQDALLFDYQQVAKETGKSLKIIGNLPFFIASPITFKLLRKRDFIECMVFMYQKEVAERILATPGGKDYGFLTVVANFYADLKPIISVAKEAFFPQPKVDSKVIKFQLLPSPRLAVENENFFLTVVKTLFSQRRKKLRNAIRPLLGIRSVESFFHQVAIDPNQRPEMLAVEKFVALSNCLLEELKTYQYEK